MPVYIFYIEPLLCPGYGLVTPFVSSINYVWCAFKRCLYILYIEQSKGCILQKACNYIRELQQARVMTADRVKLTEELLVELESLRQQCDDPRQENEILREILQQNGIDPPTLQTTILATDEHDTETL